MRGLRIRIVADPFVAGGAEFYNLAAPHPAIPTMKWEYERTIEELSGLGTAGKTAIDEPPTRLFSRSHQGQTLSRVRYLRGRLQRSSATGLAMKGYKTFSVDLREDGFTPMKEAFDIIFHVSGVQAHGPGG